jgi:ElaB/YqjD/DUF883 family membrane-anchored ribosome-binding protein
MRHNLVPAMVMAGALSGFSLGAPARHQEHHALNNPSQSQAQPSQPKSGQPGAMGPGMMGMTGQMTSMTSAMMTEHQQMSEKMDKVMQSMAATENEKDPAALKEKMAELRKQMEQMRNQRMQQRGMMGNMMNAADEMRKACPMMGDNTKPPGK